MRSPTWRRRVLLAALLCALAAVFPSAPGAGGGSRNRSPWNDEAAQAANTASADAREEAPEKPEQPAGSGQAPPPPPSAESGARPLPGLAGITYASPQRGVYVALPLGWEVKSGGFAVVTAAPIAAAEPHAPTVRIAALTAGEETLDMLWQHQVAQLELELPGSRFGAPERTIIAEEEGYRAAVSFEGEVPMRGELYLVRRGARVVTILATAPRDEFDSLAPAFAQIVASLDITITEPPGDGR